MPDGKGRFPEPDIPDGALYGVQTALALENFRISGRTLQRDFFLAHLQVKKAAALANMELGFMDKVIGKAIVDACEEAGKDEHALQFRVDVYQAGAGTSTNMNVNEVVATLASRSAGVPVHPNDHVNMLQSTNDTVPTSAMLASLRLIIERLLPALRGLEISLEEKADTYRDAVRPGRTHLRDAVLTTWGKVLEGWAGSVRSSMDELEACVPPLSSVPLGGNALGTGTNTPDGYREAIVGKLSEVSGMALKPAACPVAITQNPAAFKKLASSLSFTAQTLSRIAGDMILLSSGPNTGLGELSLPALQPGSSFMPGKVNPVIPEMMKMVCCQVQGHSYAVSEAFGEGALELNVMMPVMAWNLIDSLKILSNGVRTLDLGCVSGMEVNVERSRELAYSSLGAVTYLVPLYGYDECARLADLASDDTPLDMVISREKGIPVEEVRRLLRGEGNG